MDFFERIGEVAKNLTEKAGDSLEINRLTGEISLEKGNIQCYQRELGQYYWAKFAVGEKLDDEAMFICDKIVVSQDRMRQLELEIDNIKKEREMILDERAKAKEAEGDSNEGETTEEQPQEIIDATAIQVIEEKVEEGPKYCANCGGGIKQGQRFCIFCGAEVK